MFSSDNLSFKKNFHEHLKLQRESLEKYEVGVKETSSTIEIAIVTKLV